MLIGARQGVATVFLFLVAALVAGRLASRFCARRLSPLRAANAHATALQALGRQLAGAADVGQVVEAGRLALQRYAGGDAVAGSTPKIRCRAMVRSRSATATVPPPTGRASTASPPGASPTPWRTPTWWFLPLSADGKAIGVIGLRLPADAQRLGAEQRRLVEAMALDIGEAAVVRTRLVADLSRRASTRPSD